ncbi:MAG TPA: phosphotransferase [Thermoanaerobaculia bacterium]|jgi:hypothetical protein|nr:phosphotransferase [Thermoanaerobaculia bacterium]
MDKVNVLLVDDKSPLLDSFKMLFEILRIDAEIVLKQPTSQRLPMGGTPMPRDQELDQFDFALIDLELFTPRSGFSHSAKQMMGGNEILPYLRENAPWLPAIAQSYLLNGDAPHLLPVIGSFGFDGLLPQKLLPQAPDGDSAPSNGEPTLRLLDNSLWKSIHTGAVLQRRRAIFGPDYAGRSSGGKIKVSSSVRLPLAAFRDALAIAFHFAGDVAVEAIPAGHSGAQVFKVVVSGGKQQDARPGYWLAKVSSSPWKLQKELSAHLTMMQSGVNSAIAVPPLWSGVVVEQKLGLIAYRFADNTVPASQRVKDSLHDIRQPVASLLRRFYADGGSEGHEPRDMILRKYLPWTPNLKAVEDELPLSFRPFAAAVLDENDGRLAKLVDYTMCRIHGDLHLDNVMIGDAPVLIDFSKTDVAAIAIDAAKLIADILIRVPSLRDETLPAWNGDSKLFAELGEIAEVFRFQKDDPILFTDFLKLYLWEALYFDTTEATTREWIKRSLEAAAATT